MLHIEWSTKKTKEGKWYAHVEISGERQSHFVSGGLPGLFVNEKEANTFALKIKKARSRIINLSTDSLFECLCEIARDIYQADYKTPPTT